MGMLVKLTTKPSESAANNFIEQRLPASLVSEYIVRISEAKPFRPAVHRRIYFTHVQVHKEFKDNSDLIEVYNINDENVKYLENFKAGDRIVIGGPHQSKIKLSTLKGHLAFIAGDISSVYNFVNIVNTFVN